MSYDTKQFKETYDVITSKIKSDLDEQFNKGRLKGSDYANVYAQLMNQAVQLAFQAPLTDAQISEVNERINLLKEQESETEERTKLLQVQQDEVSQNTEKLKYETENILPEQVKEIQAETNLKKEQESLYARQIQGFDDNLKQKMLEIQLNAWSMMFSSGLLDDKPSIINNDEASSLYSSLELELGLPDTAILDIKTQASIGEVVNGKIVNYNDKYDYEFRKEGDGTFSYNGNGEFKLKTSNNKGSATITCYTKYKGIVKKIVKENRMVIRITYEELISIGSSLEFKDKDKLEALQYGCKDIIQCFKNIRYKQFCKFYKVTDNKTNDILALIALERNGYLTFFVTKNLTIANSKTFIKELRDIAKKTVKCCGSIFVNTIYWYKEAQKLNELVGFKYWYMNDIKKVYYMTEDML